MSQAVRDWDGHLLPGLSHLPLYSNSASGRTFWAGGRRKEEECKGYRLICYHSREKNNQIHFYLAQALLYLVGKNEDIIILSQVLSFLRFSVSKSLLKLPILLSLSILRERKFLP